MEKKARNVTRKEMPERGRRWISVLLAVLLLGMLVFNLGCDDSGDYQTDEEEEDYVTITNIWCANPEALVAGRPLDYRALGLNLGYKYEKDFSDGSYQTSATGTGAYPFDFSGDNEFLVSMQVKELAPAQGSTVPYQETLTVTVVLEIESATSAAKQLILPVRVPDSELAVVKQPYKTKYARGETLNLDGVVLSYTDDKGVAADIPFEEFEENGITASPVNGALLDTPGSVEVSFTHAESELATSLKVTVNEEAPPLSAPQVEASLGVVGQGSAIVNAAFSEHCTYNAVLYEGRPATPTSYTFPGAAARRQARSVTHGGLSFEGLAPGTAYTIFVYGVNANGICTAIQRLEFTTQAATQAEAPAGGSGGSPVPASGVPTWAEGPAATATSSPGGIDISFNTNVDATVYIVVLASGAPAPSASEVIAGTGQGGVAAVWITNATCGPGAPGNASTLGTGTTVGGTTYDIYLVAVNQATGDTQATPAKLSATTNS